MMCTIDDCTWCENLAHELNSVIDQPYKIFKTGYQRALNAVGNMIDEAIEHLGTGQAETLLGLKVALDEIASVL